MTTNGDGSGDLVQIRDLQMHFPVTKGIILQRQIGAVKAVDGVSFNIKQGETLGLVGESGCGKSTTGRAILQLYRPTAGSVIFHGTDLTKLKGEEMSRMRRKVQMIFQDPYASLNPRMTVGDIIGEPIKVHNLRQGKEVRVRVQELLQLVGLNPYFINRYHTSSRAGSASASVSRVRWQSSRSSWCVTSRFRRLMCRSRRRSSTCWRISKIAWI